MRVRLVYELAVDGRRLPRRDRSDDGARDHRLFDLTRGGRFTPLAFGATRAIGASPSDVRHPTDPDGLADTGGHLASAYGDVGLISAVADYLAAGPQARCPAGPRDRLSRWRRST